MEESCIFEVRRHNDECSEIVASVNHLYEKIVAPHDRHTAYAGLLVLRLLELLQATLAALHASSKVFAIGGRSRRMEFLNDVQIMVVDVESELKHLTDIESTERILWSCRPMVAQSSMFAGNSLNKKRRTRKCGP